MPFFSSAFSLFLVLNALGNVPFFLGVLGKFEVRKQKKIIFREMLIALIVLLVFNFFGERLLNLLGVSHPIIGMAGGTLLFIIALSMIFPKNTDKTAQDSIREEPLIVPLAIPIIAGPGAIATIMIFSDQATNLWTLPAIIFTAWLPSLLILLASSNLKKLLGQRGLLACQKLSGMLILLLAVQMMLSGFMVMLTRAIHNTLQQ